MGWVGVSTPAWKDPAVIDTMLDEREVWAVIGLSGDPWRTAYSIAEELQAHGKRVVPIHPSADGEKKVLGELVYKSLADVPFPVDVVDVFRRSEEAGQHVDEALAIGAKGVWFQMGVIDEAAFGRAQAAGLPMVMDICPSQVWHYRRQARA